MASNGKTGLLNNQLLYLLARAAAQASAPMHEKIRNHGLSVPEWRTLMTLADAPRTVGHLARMLHMKQPTLTRLLARLEEADLISREHDPADGRRVLVALSGRGQDLAGRLVPMALDYDAELLKTYSADEAETLKRSLRVLIERTADA